MVDEIRADIPGRPRAALMDLYEPLLDRDDHVLTPQARDELYGLARVLDLDITVDTPSAEIWRKVRAFVSRHRQDASSDDAARQGPPLTLLVVEDDPDAAQQLVEALIEAGHGVVGPASSAETAEALASLSNLDVALVDINLSGQSNGVDLARTLNTSWGVPTIFLSGDVGETARNADASVALILKPYQAADVVRALDAVVAEGLIRTE
ncbi:hypothetical protein GCM10017620_06370 [Brevundimonas intermedia]|uniref:Response regulatory domain-containing protein n=1 Tax=Brevundimonas intermedia TaxID=74315 RepID=A0ABQ5T4H2_9CAUL|nr:response regulator [Brevundimonas intermedia]GLK47664.1 hypothetical protein GCM10017620_06370 [Brevundimonas intermedia]